MLALPELDPPWLDELELDGPGADPPADCTCGSARRTIPLSGLRPRLCGAPGGGRSCDPARAAPSRVPSDGRTRAGCGWRRLRRRPLPQLLLPAQRAFRQPAPDGVAARGA